MPLPLLPEHAGFKFKSVAPLSRKQLWQYHSALPGNRFYFREQQIELFPVRKSCVTYVTDEGLSLSVCRARDVSLLHSVQIGSESPSSLLSNGYWGKAAGE
jgi:hypothetical protein